MPRAARIRVEWDKRRQQWRVNLAKDLTVEKKRRERHYFVVKAEAERFRREQENRLANYREAALGLSDVQKQEAAYCYAIILPYGRSLREAATFAALAWEHERRSVTVQELRDTVLEAKVEDKRSDKHLDQLRSLLGRFAGPDGFEGRLVQTLTGAEIDLWLRGLKRRDGKPIIGTSRDTYRRGLRLAFNIAIEKKWCTANPLKDVPRAGGNKDEVTFLEPEQVARILQLCDPSILGYVALCAFAGLRPSEAARLCWADVGSQEIYIRAAIAKTRKNRLVPVLPNLGAWLAVAPRDKTGIVGSSRVFFRKATRAAGIVPWPQDALRHSFGTYRYLTIRHEGQLALEMGNSPDIVHRHYRAPATLEAAEAFFNLLPPTP